VPAALACTSGFFYFVPFLNKIQEMNPAKTYFHVLALWSHANQNGVTHEEVVPCALELLMGLVRARRATLAGVVPRRSSCAMFSRRDSSMSHANKTGTTPMQNRVVLPFLFLPPLFRSSFLLLSSP
jgi:hypothetical protein